MTTLYRIYTERGDAAMLERTLRIVEGRLREYNETYGPDLGYTAFEGTGGWKGARETSLVVEIIGDECAVTEWCVRGIARAIRAENAQEAVLVTRAPVECEFV